MRSMPLTDERRAEPKTGASGRPGLARALLLCLALLLALEGLARWGLPVVAASEIFYDQRAFMVLAEGHRDGSPVVWLMGDSTVIGLDVAPAETPGPVLERALRRIKPGVEVRPVGNAGMGLDNAGELVGHLPLRPGDVVLVSTHPAHATDYHDHGWEEGSATTWKDRVERAARRQADRFMLVRHRHYVSRMPILLGRGTPCFPSMSGSGCAGPGRGPSAANCGRPAGFPGRISRVSPFTTARSTTGPPGSSTGSLRESTRS